MVRSPADVADRGLVAYPSHFEDDRVGGIRAGGGGDIGVARPGERAAEHEDAG